LTIGIKLLNILEKLHNQGGVVHGDIHTGNVCLSESDDEKLVLIDFARARFVSETQTDERIRASQSWNDAFLSPWEIDGFISSRRDDVFRALLVTAVLINGHEYYEYLSGQNDEISTSMTIKQTENLFIYPGTIESSNDSYVNERSDMVQNLQKALEHSRSLHSTSDKPPYGLIIQALSDALKGYEDPNI
jgi:hypothetical protein